MDRTSRILDLTIQRMGPGHYINRDNTHMFGIARKAPAGQLNADGLKITSLGWVTARQFKIMVETSRTDEEVAERIYQLIVHKNDTTVFGTKTASTISTEDLNALVERKVMELIRAKAEELEAGKAKIEELASKAAAGVMKEKAKIDAANAPHTVGKVGLQERKKKLAPKEAGLQIDADNKVVRDHAMILGFDVSDIPLQPGSRRYARRWIQKVEEAWAKHIATEQPTT